MARNRNQSSVIDETEMEEAENEFDDETDEQADAAEESSAEVAEAPEEVSAEGLKAQAAQARAAAEQAREAIKAQREALKASRQQAKELAAKAREARKSQGGRASTPASVREGIPVNPTRALAARVERIMKRDNVDRDAALQTMTRELHDAIHAHLDAKEAGEPIVESPDGE